MVWLMLNYRFAKIYWSLQNGLIGLSASQQVARSGRIARLESLNFLRCAILRNTFGGTV